MGERVERVNGLNGLERICVHGVQAKKKREMEGRGRGEVGCLINWCAVSWEVASVGRH